MSFVLCWLSHKTLIKNAIKVPLLKTALQTRDIAIQKKVFFSNETHADYVL